MDKFPVLTRTGGRCDDCKGRVEGSIYIASRDPETDEIEYQICFVHMKQRDRMIKKLERRLNIVGQFDKENA